MRIEKEKSDNQALLIPLSLILIVFLLSGIIPLNSMWGFNHLGYYPDTFKVISVLFLLLLFVPVINKRLYRIASLTAGWFERFHRIVRITVVVIFSGLILYLFRVHVHALGDGYQRVYEIERGYYYNSAEPLDFLLHSVIYKAANMILPISGETVYTLFSILCGIAFVLFLYLFRFSGPENGASGVLPKLLILSLGGVQLFFGYVESYSLVYLLALIYILLGYNFLLSGKGLLSAAVLFALALLSHQSAVVLIPSFCLLIVYNLKPAEGKKSTGSFLPLLTGLIPIIILAVLEIVYRVYFPEFKKGITEILLPLYSGYKYSMMSPHHLLDIINEFLLIAPVTIILLIGARMLFSGNSIEKRLRLYSVIVIAPTLLFIFMVDPKLGFARDWDLFAMPTAIIALVIIMVIFINGGFRQFAPRVHMPIVLAVLYLAGIWIGLNSSEEYQLKRAESLLYISDQNAGYSTELLAEYYLSEGIDNRVKALQLLNSIDDNARSPRVWHKIAESEYELGQYRRAIKAAQEGLKQDSLHVDMLLLAGASYMKLNNPKPALPFLLKAVNLEPERYNIYTFLGPAYYLLDSLSTALEVYKTAIRIQPSAADGYFSAASIFTAMGALDSAEAYIRIGLKVNPSYPMADQFIKMVRDARKNSPRNSRN